MSDDLAARALAELAGCADDEARFACLRNWEARFVAWPDAAAALAGRVAAETGEAEREDAVALLAVVLESARMARENGSAGGEPLLDAVAARVRDLDAAGVLEVPHRFAIARAFARAGLEVPATAMLPMDGSFELGGDDAGGLPDLADVLDGLAVEVGGESLPLYLALSEMMAVLPAAARATAITQVASLPQGRFERLGAYWLLDADADVRDAAAAAVLGRARAGGCTAAERARLVAVRPWLPDGAARALVDQALRASLGPAAAAPAPAPAWKLHRVVASLPDGAGAHSLAVAAQHGRRRVFATVLLKIGQGVKDAFAVPCASAAEQKRLLAEVAQGMSAVDVAPDHLVAALGHALDDGAAHGLLPAPGLVDVVEILGASPGPRAAEPKAILEAIGAEEALAALPAAERERRLADGAAVLADHPIAATWFEESSTLRDLLARKRTEKTRRTALLGHLETRRAWWADVLARAAAVAKASSARGDAWLAFTAAAAALLEGRPLAEISIMTAIADRSLEVLHDHAATSRRREAAAPVPVPWQLDAADPERPGELDQLLATAALTSPWLDGWLAAFGAAPRLVKPSAWLGPIVERLSFADEAEMQRFLDLVVARLNAGTAAAAEVAAITARLQALDPQARAAWTTGFSEFVDTFPEAWPARRPKEDRRVLAILRDAEPASLDDGFLSLLGAWIAACHARRR